MEPEFRLTRWEELELFCRLSTAWTGLWTYSVVDWFFSTADEVRRRVCRDD